MQGDKFTIALAGGSTPRGVYERLRAFQLRWNAWNVWWSDERMVPPEHSDSNERMAREALLYHVPIPWDQIHPLRSVEDELPERFDLVLLGIGPDGHTASLFPGDQALESTDPIAYVERPGLPPYHPRLTFTYPTIDAAGTAAFLVGADKCEVSDRVLAGDESLPAARVHAAETVMLREAGGG